MSLEECKDEQNGEIEAIESIYPEEITIHETDPHHVFSITLRSQETNEDAREEDAGPLMEIESETLDGDRVTELLQLKDELVEENIGMGMIFTIVAAVIEKLNEYFDENTKNREEAIERAKYLAEEAERKKFEGTKCTVENFTAWKIKFNEEKRQERLKLKLKEIDASKLTGYELFMQDKTLDDSDLKLLDPEDIAAVDVDESLFDDIDDLELEDEEIS